jgi:hypothetical protein
MNSSSAINKVSSKIGAPVNFGYPDSTEFKGKIINRSFIEATAWHGGKTIDVIDLIQFSEPRKFQAVRFGYYNIIDGKQEKIQWASRGGLAETVDDLKKLLVKTAREQPWFQNLLKDVITECK